MIASRTCSRCGAELPADAPGGHCLPCLLQLGLASDGTSPEAAAADSLPAREGGTLPPSSSLAEKPGDRIGDYKLLQQIGEGGCGIVYMAEQEQPVRRRVALKIIKLGMDTRNVIARFEAERQALAMMDHPNIAKVFDAGATETAVVGRASRLPAGRLAKEGRTTGETPARAGGTPAPLTGGTPAPLPLSAGRPYFVMELVRGVKITSYCDQQKLSTRQRLDLFIQVCQAVQHAHQKGIIHRDLKPSNILVTEQDGAPMPKIIDFGIAKATGEQRLTDKTLFTAFEQFIGTPAYMSPEQAGLGGLDIDTRSDIYSLGVLLYELLTGQAPFDAEQLSRSALDEVLRTIREQEPPRPSTRLTTLSEQELTTVAQRRQTEASKLPNLVRGDLDWIVMKALDKDRRRRYETANALATDLRRHLNHEPVIARPPSRLYEFQKTVRRHKFGFAAAGAVILALALGLGISTWSLVKERQARERAVAAELRARTEADKSQQVAQFLKDMLKGVQPSVALGRDTTVLKEILDKTAERAGKNFAEQPEVEAELLSTIGNTYFELEDFPKAEAMHRVALRLRTARFGETNSLVADSLHDLGNALWKQPKPAEAEAVHRRALVIRRTLFGGQHRDVAYSLSYLALVLNDLGKWAEAEQMFRDALSVGRKVIGNESPEVALCLNELGLLLRNHGNLVEAETMHREALAIRRRLLGSESPAVAQSLVNLATVLLQEGKLEEVEPFENEALALFKKLLNAERPDPAASAVGLGRLLQARGRLADAEAILRTEWVCRSKLYGDQHPAANRALSLLVDVLLLQKKFGEIDEVLKERVERLRARLPPDPVELASALISRASNLMAGNQFIEAEPIVRECLGLREKDMPDDWRTFNARSLLGGCLIGRKRYAEAEPLLIAGYEGMKRREDKIPANFRFLRMKQALQRLVQLFEVTARSDRVAAWKSRLIELHEKSADELRRSADTGNLDAVNNLAWLLATCPLSEARDGRRAIAYGEKAVAATSRTNAMYLDTLAAAHAQAGDFDKAVAIQQEAMALSRTEGEKQDYASRLKLYESGSPYHERE